jgi:hypothetical protein
MKSVNITLVTLFVFTLNNLLAAPGDTTHIRVHDAVDMVWYENYDQSVSFPTSNTTYGKILMHYTMGCASTGCSDWDYTTKIELLKPLGVMDSTIASIDVISEDPYEADTTWTVFEVKEAFELARVITPYGGYMRAGTNGYNSNWKHVHTFDVTDYAPLLKGDVDIRAFYGGWSSGFSVTIDFEFIEGTPPRDVIEVRNLWQSGGNGWNFSTTSTFNNEYLAPISIDLPEEMSSSKVRIIPSGHGFDNSTGCAEFCEKNYYLKLDGTQIGTNLMWDDQCGSNPIFPQGGTWLYDRANWCPGLRTHHFDHNLTSHVTAGGTSIIDLDFENINWTGNQAPIYILETQLFIYDEINHTVDAAIEDILSPTNKDDYKRLNPICKEARVSIKNYGSQPLTSATLRYAINNNHWRTYEWTGNLGFEEDEIVVLPITEQWEWVGNEATSLFEVRIENPNGMTDENPTNNHLTSRFNNTPMLPGVLEFQFRTNNQPQQTTWKLFDSAGNVLKENENGMLASTLYRDTFDLEDGCYLLQIEDSGENGLSWWANNEGSGYARLRIPGAGFAHSFPADFGTAINYHFTIGYALQLPEFTPPTLLDFSIYPNPSKDKFTIQTNDIINDAVTIYLVNILGQTIEKREVRINQNTLNEEFNVEDLDAGSYTISVIGKTVSARKQVIVQ